MMKSSDRKSPSWMLRMAAWGGGGGVLIVLLVIGSFVFYVLWATTPAAPLPPTPELIRWPVSDAPPRKLYVTRAYLRSEERTWPVRFVFDERIYYYRYIAYDTDSKTCYAYEITSKEEPDLWERLAPAVDTVEELSICDTVITDEGWDQIAAMPNLRVLRFMHMELGQADLDRIRALRSLRTIYFHDVEWVGDIRSPITSASRDMDVYVSEFEKSPQAMKAALSFSPRRLVFKPDSTLHPDSLALLESAECVEGLFIDQYRLEDTKRVCGMIGRMPNLKEACINGDVDEECVELLSQSESLERIAFQYRLKLNPTVSAAFSRIGTLEYVGGIAVGFGPKGEDDVYGLRSDIAWD